MRLWSLVGMMSRRSLFVFECKKTVIHSDTEKEGREKNISLVT
jgi:hypothetical protein